jgi:hypothetical protein
VIIQALGSTKKKIPEAAYNLPMAVTYIQLMPATPKQCRREFDVMMT